MILLISDSNILFDLYYGNLLEIISLLPYQFGVSDAILSELINPPPKKIIPSDFQVFSLSSHLVSEVYYLKKKYGKPSLPDLFSLVVAKEKSAILVTGDSNLRKAASKENVECKGILWILDKLVENSLISNHKAVRSF